LRSSETYDGDRLFTIDQGRRVMTPMLLVMVTIGGTDVLFALDSIPAIFGLTQSVFIVFTATAFSLLGLRQLYFLIDGLLDRLIYLSYGLAAILGFIGIKLILHALHENNLPFVNGAEPVHVPEISTRLSLTVIAGLLIVTVITSLVSVKVPAVQAEHLTNNSRGSHHDPSAAGATAWPARVHLPGNGGHLNGMAKRRLSLISGILVLVALVLVLLAATVTSGAIDGFEIGVALVLLVVSYLVQRDVRRRTTYERRPDDKPPPPMSSP
jgi:hypothetical protein